MRAKIPGLAAINVIFSMRMYHMFRKFTSIPGEVSGEALFLLPFVL
jgi:hypothetical protein